MVACSTCSAWLTSPMTSAPLAPLKEFVSLGLSAMLEEESYLGHVLQDLVLAAPST